MTTYDLKTRVLRAILGPILRLWITHFWGPRCQYRDPDCHGCDAWTMYYKIMGLEPPEWPLDVEQK